MNDDTRGKLQRSLFSPTSAFTQPEVELPIVTPGQTITPSPSERMKRVAALIEQAYGEIYSAPTTDSDNALALSLLEEALEEARKHG